MKTLIFIVFALVAVQVTLLIFLYGMAAWREIRKLREKKRSNYVVLNGRRYWLKTLPGTSGLQCDRCKLQRRCKSKGTDICNIFDGGGADNVVMTDEDDDEQ